MLQPLGISAEAEAVYLVLAPIGNATSAELSELSSVPSDELERRLDELRKLGLATEVSRGTWRSPKPASTNTSFDGLSSMFGSTGVVKSGSKWRTYFQRGVRIARCGS